MTVSTYAPESRDQQSRTRHDANHARTHDSSTSSAPQGDLELALRERVKELTCLYEISRLVEKHRDREEPILQGIVDLLPSAWQYPEICSARLVVHDREYRSRAYRHSPWSQSASVKMDEQVIGAVEISYHDPMPECDGGPFLKEERDLIDAVAVQIGHVLERLSVQRQLVAERAALAEANSALKRVFAQIEEEKAEIYRAVAANVEKILAPTLRALAAEMPAEQRRYLTLLQSQLGELTSPFASKIAGTFSNLTPAELEICNMIRGGMSTKEIANHRHVSPATVAKQRERIRRKLKISGTDTNLTTHLLMLGDANPDPMPGLPNSAIVY